MFYTAPSFATLGITEKLTRLSALQHSVSGLIMLSVVFYCYAEFRYAECCHAVCRYAECYHAECRGAAFCRSFILV